jgi:hypothetical protein
MSFFEHEEATASDLESNIIPHLSLRRYSDAGINLGLEQFTGIRKKSIWLAASRPDSLA